MRERGGEKRGDEAVQYNSYGPDVPLLACLTKRYLGLVWVEWLRSPFSVANFVC